VVEEEEGEERVARWSMIWTSKERGNREEREEEEGQRAPSPTGFPFEPRRKPSSLSLSLSTRYIEETYLYVPLLEILYPLISLLLPSLLSPRARQRGPPARRCLLSIHDQRRVYILFRLSAAGAVVSMEDCMLVGGRRRLRREGRRVALKSYRTS